MTLQTAVLPVTIRTSTNILMIPTPPLVARKKKEKFQEASPKEAPATNA
jgi:hypothetical protein